MTVPAPKFAADRMLGRLATWLRLLGVDTLYGPQWSGLALLRAARADGRIVLTRDTRLRRAREAPPLLFVDSDHFRDQLRQVISAYHFDPHAALLTRCARCNVPLHAASPDTLPPYVPAYVRQTQATFVRCPRCHRVYWHATHGDRIRVELERLGYPPPAH